MKHESNSGVGNGQQNDNPYNLEVNLRMKFKNFEQAREAGERLSESLRGLGVAALESLEINLEAAHDDLPEDAELIPEPEIEAREAILISDKGEILSKEERYALDLSRRGFIDRFGDQVSQPKALNLLRKFSEVRNVRDILVIGKDKFLHSKGFGEGALEATEEALGKLLPNETWHERPTPEENARICTDLFEVHEAVLPDVHLQSPKTNGRVTVGHRILEDERRNQEGLNRRSVGYVRNETNQYPNQKTLYEYAERFLAARAAIKSEEN